MGKKTRKPYEPVGITSQIERILDAAWKSAPETTKKSWGMLFDILMQLFQGWIDDCPEDSVEVATNLGIVRVGERTKKARELVDDARKDGEKLNRRNAKKLVRVAVRDARKNPKDTAASVRELRGE